MVVGLLTMIAMLGGTFLVIAHVDAQQSEALVAKAQADPLASGTVSEIMAKLADRLTIGTQGPYSGSDADFAQYASDAVSKYLYYYHKDGGGAVTEWLSVIMGDSSDKVDVDGDGLLDGYRLASGVMNPRGERYYWAGKIVDLSGKACVNTGYAPDWSKLWSRAEILPTYYDLRSHLGASVFSSLNTERAGSSTTPTVWFTEVAKELLNPPITRKPYAIGDEMFLRWLADGAMSETGRLYSVLKDLSKWDRSKLTTFSCSRILLRHPASGFYTRVKPSRVSDRTVQAHLLQELSSATGQAEFGEGGEVGGDFRALFDIGTSSSPVESGYERVHRSTTYGTHGSLVYGWKSGTRYDYDRRTGTYVSRDFVYTPDATFAVSVPQGDYQVTVMLGDVGPYAHDLMQVYVQGQLVGTESTAGGQTVTRTYETTLAGDGELTVRLRDGGGSDANVVIESIEVVQVGQTVQSQPLPTSGAAAHFLANLWASNASPAAAQAAAFDIEYKVKGAETRYKVYGVVDQPFIVEAFAQHQQSGVEAGTGDSKRDYYWGSAIRLMNPAKPRESESRLINLQNRYKITGLTGDDHTFSANIPISQNGGWVVLYDIGFDPEKRAEADVLSELGFKQSNAERWHRVPGLRFLSGVTLRIFRVVGGHDLPIDSVSSGPQGGEADLNYDFSKTDIDETAVDNPTTEKADIRRDDNLTRGRYSVAVYAPQGDSHALSANNMGIGTGSGAGNIPITPTGTGVRSGYNLAVPHLLDWAKCAGDLGELFVVGPTGNADWSPRQDLPHALKEYIKAENASTKDAARKQESRAHVDYRGKVNASATRYPDVPWGTLLAEMFRFIDPDTSRLDDTARRCRVYGRININTATPSVLQRLPWPIDSTDPNNPNIAIKVGGVPITISLADIVSEIVDYRDKKGGYSGGRAAATGITSLRDGSKHGGFMTPGEIAIPLARYMDTRINDKSHADYLQARDALYRTVSNAITVNGDVFAVNLLVELGKPAKYTWHYVAVIDRSNCHQKDDFPAMLLFSQVR